MARRNLEQNLGLLHGQDPFLATRSGTSWQAEQRAALRPGYNITTIIICNRHSYGSHLALPLAMPLPNLRRIFSSSRTDDQERAVSRQAFFRFCSFLTSCAVIALLSSPKRRRAIGL